MNRIILIGNGFDLAHGLKTSYKDFIDWYWDKRIGELHTCHTPVCQDALCCFEVKGWAHWHLYCFSNCFPRTIPYQSAQDALKILEEDDDCTINKSPLFARICRDIELKGWVDIEYDYYLLLADSLENEEKVKLLNEELDCLQLNLTEYLGKQILETSGKCSGIEKNIYEPIASTDISIKSMNSFETFARHRSLAGYCDDNDWKIILEDYGLNVNIKNVRKQSLGSLVSLPDKILLLDFNYTSTSNEYMKVGERNGRFGIIHIHGQLSIPQSIIFGYGDELDETYNKIKALNKNLYLNKIKSVRYLEASNYRRLLSFIESDNFQIYIMGHSCGNSDRTLLNTLFEHDNCVSIKPFYYEKDGKDNYLDLVQNISRNFTDPKKFRDRVVNKEYCHPLPQISTK